MNSSSGNARQAGHASAVAVTDPGLETVPAGGPGKASRYEDLIRASIEVFSRTNYDKATTALIAREAGIAEGTIYRYFSSKKELFLACFRYVTQLLAERYAVIYWETADEPGEYLRRVAKSYLEFLRENPSMRKFLAFILNSSFDKDFFSELQGFVEMNIMATESMVKKAIDKGDVRKDVDPRGAAWLFVGCYFTFILMTELDAEEIGDPTFVDKMLDMVMR